MKGMRKTVGTAGSTVRISIELVTIGSMLLMKPLLVFMHTPEDIFEDAYTYIMIICAGIAVTVLYNLLSSILRALGDSRTPLYFLVLSAVLNIALDLVLIIVFHMGSTCSCLCHSNCSGCFRCGLSALYLEKSTAFKVRKRRFQARGISGENTA